eukprot:evm.model.scf_1310.2 EVM.evm.TU.scf_1310.2   scf_1310:6764-17692(+)
MARASAPARAAGRVEDAGSEDAGDAVPAELARRVDELIRLVRPARESERRRYAIADYISGIITQCFSPEHKVEAFMFGSVPLRTYLPDGDIDLSIFCKEAKGLQDTWNEKLHSALQQEVDNPKARFKISCVLQINAEVKLLKCVVDDILVDISFNQIGGLCTLNFLEAMDRKIGGKHLFKRSVILIKAWCYYESRVLGAQYSLLSTYALETMVLHIFNIHHDTLCSPLEVLQKFLSVFHRFKWGKYCLTLSGPVALADFDSNGANVNPPEVQGVVLLTPNFMKLMLESYSYTPVAPTNTKGPAFPKCLNIMDPLLHSNNLGRSVSQTSEMRIKNAFGHVSRMLKDVINLYKHDSEASVEQLDKVFKNTWLAHRHPHRGVPARDTHPCPRATSNGQHGRNGTCPTAENAIGSGAPSGNTLPPPPPPGPSPGPLVTPKSNPQSTAERTPRLDESINLIAHRAAAVAAAQHCQAKGGNSGTGMGSNAGDARTGFDPSAHGGRLSLGGNPQVERGWLQAGNQAGIEGFSGLPPAMQFSALDQWNSLQQQQQQKSWIMQQCVLPSAQAYQIQNSVATGREAESKAVNGASAARASHAASSRVDLQKGGLPRVRSAPELGGLESVASRRRDRSLNRRVHYVHPLPYPRAWPSRPLPEDLARTGAVLQHSQSSAQCSQTSLLPRCEELTQVGNRGPAQGMLHPCPSEDPPQVSIGSKPKPQPTMLQSRFELDEGVRAKLEKNVARKFADCDQGQRGGANGDTVAVSCAHTSLDQAEMGAQQSPGHYESANCEPPYSTDFVAEMPVSSTMLGTGGKAAGQKMRLAAALGEGAKRQAMQGGMPQEVVRLGLPKMLTGRMMQAGVQAPHMPHETVVGLAENPSYPPLYPLFVPHMQVGSNQAFGMVPTLGSAQHSLATPAIMGRQPSPRMIAGMAALKPLSILPMEQHVTSPESYGAAHTTSGVVRGLWHGRGQPVMAQIPSSNHGGMGVDAHLSPAQGHLSQQVPPPAMLSMAPDQSRASWAYAYPTTSQAALQRSSTDVFSDTSSSGDDILSGDIETLTQHLEVARNLVGRKQPERERPPVGSKPTANVPVTPSARTDGPQGPGQGHNRTRHSQHAEDGVRGSMPARRPQCSDQHSVQGYCPREVLNSTRPHVFQQPFQGHASDIGGPLTAHLLPYTPPPPPPQARGSEQPMPVADNVVFQVPPNRSGHSRGGYFVRSPAGAATAVSTPGISPMYGALHTGASLVGMPSVISLEGNGRAGARGEREARGSDWNFKDTTAHTAGTPHAKPVALSTDDGKFVEIDPSVLRAVEAALAGMMGLREAAREPSKSGESKWPRDENGDPPTDGASPRDQQAEASASPSRHTDNGAKRGRHSETSIDGQMQRPRGVEAKPALMHQNPDMFGPVNPAANNALALLAGGGARRTQRLAPNSMMPDASQRLGPSSQADAFLAGRGTPSYGTGRFIPPMPHESRAASGGGDAHARGGHGGDPDPRVGPEALGEREGSNDGSWTTSSSVSLNTGSDRGDLDHRAHHRRIPAHHRHGRGRPWQDHAEHVRRPGRGAQAPYGWHDPQLLQAADRGHGLGEIEDFYGYGPPAVGGYYYPVAHTRGHCAYGGGYPVPEEYNAPGVWYEYDGLGPKGHRGGGVYGGWRAGPRRGDREDGRWGMHGWTSHDDRSQTDRSSTPDSANGHPNSRGEAGRGFQRRGEGQWGGLREPGDGQRYARYGQQGTGYYGGQRTYGSRRIGTRRGRRGGGADDGGIKPWGRGPPGQIRQEVPQQQQVLGAVAMAQAASEGQPAVGRAPRAPPEGPRLNGHRGLGPGLDKARSYALNSDDFPAMETSTPRASGAPPQLGSPVQAVMPDGGVNPALR